MEVYDTVLNLLDIDKADVDDAKAEQIKAIIELVSSRLTGKLSMLMKQDITEVPEELKGIVVEVCVNRFNRIGSEGASSHSIDGETFAWADTDYFEPYESDINAYVAKQGHSVGIQFI